MLRRGHVIAAACAGGLPLVMSVACSNGLSDTGDLGLPPRSDASKTADGAKTDGGEDPKQDSNVPKPPCVMDSRTFVVLGGNDTESITGRGRYWNFFGPTSMPDQGNGGDLIDVPRYKAGPCAGKTLGTCLFDSRTFVLLGPTLFESITAYGKYWNFATGPGVDDPNNGKTLDSVPRYATGPCTGIAAGTCTFDTRTFSTLGGTLTEAITAYGKFWNFVDDVPDPANGSDLTSLARYASGPCMGVPSGTCKLDTRAYAVKGGVLYESITAYGKYWNFTGPDPDPNNGSTLESVPRYASGPCE